MIVPLRPGIVRPEGRGDRCGGKRGWRWPLGRSIAAAVFLSGCATALLLVQRTLVPMVVILALTGFACVLLLDLLL